MTSNKRDSELGPLELEASRWIMRLVSGEATVSDAISLKQWRRQSREHEEAYAAAAQHWEMFGLAGQDLQKQGLGPVWTPSSRMPDRRAVLAGLGVVGAGTLGYGLVHPPFGLWPSLMELTANYRTAKGQQKQIVLAENISARLNTQTSLVLSENVAARRQVRLISGEAAFSNASGNPLVVVAGDGQTVALRAKFEVRNIEATVCVTCVSGNVQVWQAGKATEVQPGRQVRYDEAGLRPVTAVDLPEATAWQEGLLIFRFTPLSRVIAEINRYRSGLVVLMKSTLATDPVNGRFSIEHIDDAIDWIKQIFGMTATSLPGGIVLLH
ncbi:MAG: FecR domain-containing protein [Pseudomonadota bacterium]